MIVIAILKDGAKLGKMIAIVILTYGAKLDNIIVIVILTEGSLIEKIALIVTLTGFALQDNLYWDLGRRILLQSLQMGLGLMIRLSL